ncbi:MAG: BON domain-containing protein [Steroidobacteraceae bacterium]
MNLCNWAYAVTAAVILAAASACVTTPAKSPQQAERDRETAADVQRALAADKSIYTEHVNVRADNGVVHLSGYIWSDTDRYDVEQTVESVPGVNKVVDEMDLEREGIDNSPVSR